MQKIPAANNKSGCFVRTHPDKTTFSDLNTLTPQIPLAVQIVCLLYSGGVHK